MLNNGQRVLDSGFYTAENGYFDLYLDAVDDKTHTVALYLYSTEINALNVEIYDDVTAAQPKLLEKFQSIISALEDTLSSNSTANAWCQSAGSTRPMLRVTA